VLGLKRPTIVRFGRFGKVYNLVLLQKLGLEKWLKMAPQLWNQYFRGKKERGGDELKV